MRRRPIHESRPVRGAKYQFDRPHGKSTALAFAALAAEGLEVHEVTRGAIGPAVCGSAGPQLLPLGRPALSASLERASRDLERVRVDDPLPDAITLPADGAGFGLVAARKWAVAHPDRPAVLSWFRDRGLRALVYGYAPTHPDPTP